MCCLSSCASISVAFLLFLRFSYLLSPVIISSSSRRVERVRELLTMFGEEKKSRSLADVTDDEIRECCNAKMGRPVFYSEADFDRVKEDISNGAVKGMALQLGSDSRGLKIQIHGAGNPIAKPGTLTAALQLARSASHGGKPTPLPSRNTIIRAKNKLVGQGFKARKADQKEARRLQVLACGYNAISAAAVMAAMGLLVDEAHGICPSDRIPHALTANYDETTFLINDDSGVVEVIVAKKELAFLAELHQSVSTAKTVGGPNQKRCVKMGVTTTRAGSILSSLFEIHDRSFKDGVAVDKVSKISIMRFAFVSFRNTDNMLSFILQLDDVAGRENWLIRVGPKFSPSDLAEKKISICVLPSLRAVAVKYENSLVNLSSSLKEPATSSSAAAPPATVPGAATSSSSSSAATTTNPGGDATVADDDDDDDDPDQDRQNSSDGEDINADGAVVVDLTDESSAAASSERHSFSVSPVQKNFDLKSPYTGSLNAVHDAYSINFKPQQQQNLNKAYRSGSMTGSKAIDKVAQLLSQFYAAHIAATKMSERRPKATASFVQPTMPEIGSTGIRRVRTVVKFDGEHHQLNVITKFLEDYTKKESMETIKVCGGGTGIFQPDDLMCSFKSSKNFVASAAFRQFVLPTDMNEWPMLARQVHTLLSTVPPGHRFVFAKFFYNTNNMISSAYTETNIRGGWNYMDTLDGVLRKWPPWNKELTADEQQEIRNAIPVLARNVVENTGTVDDDFAYGLLGHILGNPIDGNDDIDSEDDDDASEGSDGATEGDDDDDDKPVKVARKEATTENSSFSPGASGAPKTSSKSSSKTKVRDMVLNRQRTVWCSSEAGRFHMLFRDIVAKTKKIAADLKRELKNMQKEEKSKPTTEIRRLVAEFNQPERKGSRQVTVYVTTKGGGKMTFDPATVKDSDVTAVQLTTASKPKKLATKCANVAFCNPATNTVDRTKCDECNMTFCSACVAAGYMAKHKSTPACAGCTGEDEEEVKEEEQEEEPAPQPKPQSKKTKSTPTVGASEGGGGGRAKKKKKTDVKSIV
jgi:hypothetical protein